jgi:hypothetical protein
MVPIGTRLGVYEIVEPLGQGGMGEVYRARDTRLDRDVALKILPESFSSDPDRLMRFEREAKTLAALNHPHIAHIYGVEDAGTRRAIVMELVDGEDLAQRIARGALPLDNTLPIARQLAEALEAAHEAGIVHRDLKPANIKLRPDGTVKVLDFGLAKQAATTAGASAVLNSPTITSPAMTQAGLILGTAAYMAPEQAKGKPVDRRADIWAFGCVLYEMLTGRRAFEGEDVTDTIAAVVTREPDWTRLPVATPSSVAWVMRRCLEKNAARRVPHMSVARLALEKEASDVPLEVRRPPGARWRTTAITAIAGAVVGAVAVYLASRPALVPAGPGAPIQLAVATAQPHSAANGVMISPDGRYLVMRGSGGASSLHALDGSPARSIDHTAYCWSPDSRRLVLARTGSLLKWDVAGGPPVEFATLSDVSGCSWSEQGTVLISARSGLYQVPASGGQIQAVPLGDNPVDAANDSLITRPQFLPDGRRFLYWGFADGRRAVRVGSLDSPHSSVVIASDAPAVFASGYLLFQRGAALVAQPFAAERLVLSGEARAITLDAAPGGVVNHAQFDASPGGMLVFSTTNGGVRGQLAWLDRQGNILGSIPQHGGTELLHPALSPDGSRVAGSRMDPATGNWDIWIVEVRSGVANRMTSHAALDTDPVWSPDGSAIVYVSRRADAPGIYRISLENQQEQLLLDSKAMPTIPNRELRTTDWTRDGRFIVYEADGNVMALPTVGTGAALAVVATPAIEGRGRVSHDGRWIAFRSTEAGGSHVFVQPFPGPGARTRVSVNNAATPQWSGDGKELFWNTTHPHNAGANTLYSVNLTLDGDRVQASIPQMVFPPHVEMVPLIDNRPHFAVAADGRGFLVRRAESIGPAVKVILNWPAMLPRE